MSLAAVIATVIELWLAIGLLFSLAFVTVGVQRVDRGAIGAPWGFRLLLIPGATMLWPLLLARWLRGRGTPEERNAHRAAAQSRAE